MWAIVYARNGPISSLLLKSWEKSKPTLGWPRTTDSLCPDCVKEAREAIINGKKDWTDLIHEKVGEIKAQIVERDGQVWMVKECAIHGKYEDLMAVWTRSSWNGSRVISRDAIFRRTTTRRCTITARARFGTGADAVLTVDLDEPLQHDVRPPRTSWTPTRLDTSTS